jgi:hypothetical protein
MRIDGIYLNSQANTSSNNFWDYIIGLLQGDVNLMQGYQPAIEEQLQDYLNALAPFMSMAGSGTQKAFYDLNAAFQEYKENPDMGNAAIEAALGELQSNPLNLTDAQFQNATLEVIDQLSACVSSSDLHGASDVMNILRVLVYSGQLPQAYVENFMSSTTPLMAAFNDFLQSLITGGPPPSQAVIDALLEQIEEFKKTV